MDNFVSTIKRLEQTSREVEKEYDSDIQLLKEKIKQLEEEKEQRISALSYAIEELRKHNKVCETCNGKGDVRRMDAAGDMDWEECESCNGSGKAKYTIKNK